MVCDAGQGAALRIAIILAWRGRALAEIKQARGAGLRPDRNRQRCGRDCFEMRLRPWRGLERARMKKPLAVGERLHRAVGLQCL